MAVGRTFPNEIDRMFTAPGGTLGREARRIALEIAQTASEDQARRPRHPGDKPRTGRLERGYEVRVAGRSTIFSVINRVPYAAANELGAVPHRISARRISYLKFKGRDGRWRQVKMVKHPGNPAYRVLETAAIKVVTRNYGAVRII